MWGERRSLSTYGVALTVLTPLHRITGRFSLMNRVQTLELLCGCNHLPLWPLSRILKLLEHHMVLGFQLRSLWQDGFPSNWHKAANLILLGQE